ncbi:hypothetical protein H4582DRAFT_2065117 [Lactarius indigo]|nr:hypothetical protein H4582DRAFT_2065117 [Lactarius indigo]
MTSLLSIASVIEAAVAAYVSVRDVTDRAEWKRHLEKEKAKATKVFRQVKKDNSGEAPALHPTLAALYIVLDADGDLSEITRTNPGLKRHKYYQPGAKFPQDISDLLPSEGRWWETLVAESRNVGPPPKTVPHHLPRVKLILPDPPADYAAMQVDGSQKLLRATRNRRQCEGAAEAAAVVDSRKRKRPLPSGDKTKKRHAGPSRQQRRPAINDEDEFESEDDDDNSNSNDDSSSDDGYEEEDEIEEEEEEEEDDEVDEIDDDNDDNDNNDDDNDDSKGGEEGEGENEYERYKFKCSRCTRAGVDCQTRPTGPCIRCKEKKQQCSLMPINAKTGKADRRILTAKQVFKFRLEQLKGKQPRRGVRVGSDSVAFASRMVGRMKLDSGSSHGHSRSAASVSPSAAESPVPPSAELFPAVDAAAEPSVPTPTSIPIISATAAPSPAAAVPPTTATAIPPAAATPIPPTPAADFPVPIDDHSPSIAPALRRHVSSKRKKLVPYVLVPNPPPSVSSQQQSSAAQESQVPSPSSSSMVALERRVAAIEEWIRVQDENWKGRL